jgi:hypothetical protein
MDEPRGSAALPLAVGGRPAVEEHAEDTEEAKAARTLLKDIPTDRGTYCRSTPSCGTLPAICAT